MSNKVFKTIDLPKEELAQMWEESEDKRVKYQSEVYRLEKDSKHWRSEAEKFERISNKHRKEYVNDFVKFILEEPKKLYAEYIKVLTIEEKTKEFLGGKQ